MIKDTTNLDIINNFLNNFDSKINSLGVYSHYMVYEVDDKDIGFLSYDLIYDRIEIEYIFVDKNYRNKGIASIMLEELLKIGNMNNCKNISLEVRESNLVAINFYKKHNFNNVAKREKYYKNEDGLLMVRELV